MTTTEREPMTDPDGPLAAERALEQNVRSKLQGPEPPPAEPDGATIPGPGDGGARATAPLPSELELAEQAGDVEGLIRAKLRTHTEDAIYGGGLS